MVDNGDLSRQSYVKDLNSMESFMNGIYVSLNRYFEHGISAAYPELAADNLKPLHSCLKACGHIITGHSKKTNWEDITQVKEL